MTLHRATVALALLVLSPLFTTAADRPNIIFLCSDDQRFDTIRALGNPVIETPNLDRMVGSGFTFTHAYCMGSMQGAVCVPSRAMFLSGRSLFRINEQLNGIPTWPETFRKGGYHTVGIGKWHNGPASYARSFDAGGPIFFGGMGDQNSVNVQSFDPSGKYPKANLRVETKYSTTLFTDAAVDFVDGYRDEKPFFLYVTFTVPHDPRTPPKGYETKYDPARIPLPNNYLPKHQFNNVELLVRDEKLLGWPRTEEQIRQELSNYYAMITHLDSEVGRLLDTVQRRGFDKNTVVIFTSDHGLAIGSHGLLGKQNLYEHSMRPPLILRGPGIPAGKRSDAFVYLFDLFPTACELCGVAPPSGVEGKSLIPVMNGRQQKVRDTIFCAYRQVQRSVRNDRWKLIRYPHINHIQLFDLKADPDEKQNLAADPTYADKVKEMMHLLEGQQRQYGDTLPLSTDKPAPFEIELKW
jgi:arylsulfatase A-like enzyme